MIQQHWGRFSQYFHSCAAFSALRYFQRKQKETLKQIRGPLGSMYASGLDGARDEKLSAVRAIDLRSDTVTTPTDEMKAAMSAAEVGDDVYGEDPSINALQTKAAELTGKEAALFVPSGTMGNLISVMAHCTGRGEEILVGDMAHIAVWEQGGVSQVAGVHSRQVHTNPDGTLDLSDLEHKIRPIGDAHLPISRLICLEQTHNGAGGRVLSIEYLRKVKDLATKYGLNVHLDGARLFNAATALDVPVSSITKHVDSGSFCLSKGLGAPVGSIVVGDKSFIARCVRHRKVLGGGMRQAGILAAAGIYALDNIAPKLKQDHANTKALAQGIHALSHLGLNVELSKVETNMVYFNVNNPQITATDLVDRMGNVTDSELEESRVIVKMLTAGESSIRLVLHHQVSEDDVKKTLEKLKTVLTF